MTTTIIPTVPYKDQQPGTSGLRKKVSVFQQKNYTANFIQSTFNALRSLGTGVPEVIVVGGDGRYYLREAIEFVLKIAAGNGVKRVWVGQHGLFSTPAVSAVMRRRFSGSLKATGAFILTASHNSGGPNADFGIKYNVSNGGPAPERVTAQIFEEALKIEAIQMTSHSLEFVDLSQLGIHTFGDFVIEVIEPLEDYVSYMQEIFDFDAIRRLISRPGFSMHVDCLNGISGPYVLRILHECLGVPVEQLHNTTPLPDFGGCHPDPNLTYAAQLVKAMGLGSDGSISPSAASAPPFCGVAFDGDADRNMILGDRFFVNPSDSLAVLAANADVVPFFKRAGGLKAVARSMPTSSAVDVVACKKNLARFEVPTGWKFFGNLMDSKELFGGCEYNPLICGEESFGTGSNHIREKDGIWTFLLWLSVLAARNEKSVSSDSLCTVQDVVEDHWSQYGRHYYSRYDYENVTLESANAVIDTVLHVSPAAVPPLSGSKCAKIDNFEYTDPVDGSVSSKQGVRVLFDDGSRFVLRLSGTGSTGTTIRLYLEQYMSSDRVVAHLKSKTLPPANVALKELIGIALNVSTIPSTTGRLTPTVIT